LRRQHAGRRPAHVHFRPEQRDAAVRACACRQGLEKGAGRRPALEERSKHCVRQSHLQARRRRARLCLCRTFAGARRQPALNSRRSESPMNTMTDTQNLSGRTVVAGRRKMTPSEAFVETLVAQGVTEVFGIVGSAYMDALDLFPLAGIRFISVAHEQGAGHMADGYARASGRHGVCIAQNGPGVTNFVTAVAAAYWAHSPVVVITPETGSATLGLGGFQETE